MTFKIEVRILGATRKLTIAVIAISLLCAGLIVYIVHERILRHDAVSSCPPPLAVSDFYWFLSYFAVDGSSVRNIRARTPQEHWGEYEFAIFEKVLNSFVPLDDDVVPPWYYYNDSPWPPQEWHHNNRPIQPFDMIFTLWAWDAYANSTLWYAERIDFGYSEAYGAFAASRFGNFPRGARCGVRRYFSVDADALFALLNVLELGAGRIP